MILPEQLLFCDCRVLAGSSLGPLVMGISTDYLGGFAPSLWIFAGFAGIISIAGFWATPPVKHAN